ncbi:50S ribosomal protein L19e [Candidatus Woesearchaeota archaeon]|nr:50S ribosomal protein L19e [Candidatus Woesearchaeota archaeon]
MNLSTQKRLAAEILKCGGGRVILDQNSLEEIKEAITKADIRGLISRGVIRKVHSAGVSRARANKAKIQRRKGRQKGYGSRKGKSSARLPRKEVWMAGIRVQREFLSVLKEKGAIGNDAYRNLYLKSKGGFFRSKRHIKLYIQEQGLLKK